MSYQYNTTTTSCVAISLCVHLPVKKSKVKNKIKRKTKINKKPQTYKRKPERNSEKYQPRMF